MIIIIPEKVLDKKIKKLVYHKDYMIIDGTGNDSLKHGLCMKYGNVKELDAFDPGSKVARYLSGKKDKDGLVLDKDKMEAKIKEWLSGRKLLEYTIAVGNLFITGFNRSGIQFNIFLVLRKEIYKKFAETLQEKFYETYQNTKVKFVYTWEEVLEIGDGKMKKVLEKDLSKKKMLKIDRINHELFQMLRKTSTGKIRKRLQEQGYDFDAPIDKTYKRKDKRTKKQIKKDKKKKWKESMPKDIQKLGKAFRKLDKKYFKHDRKGLMESIIEYDWEW